MTDDDNRYTVRISTEDGERVYENVRIQSLTAAKAEADQLREQAPDPEWVCEQRTADIDAVIEALQAAKAQGVDTVYVNDDGMNRQLRPRITNNYYQYVASRPKPDELREWVEL